MKSLLSLTLLAVFLGFGFGSVLAYFEVPDVINPLGNAPAPQSTDEVPEAKSLPRAEFAETVYEFGNIERGASMSHVFKVRNLGELPLHVEVASTTCKCTVGDLSDNDIGPNEEAEILLEWVAKTPPGPFRHGAVIRTSDPTQSSVDLTVEGQVVESTSMVPSHLFFGTMRAGKTPTASLYLMQFLDEELEISSCEISPPELAEQMEVNTELAAVEELPSPGALMGMKVSVTYKSGKTVGPFQGWLTIKTNLEEAEELVVPIVGNVVGDVSIFGPGWIAKSGALRMGSFTSSEGKSVALKVAVRGEHAQESELEVVEVDPPELKATLGEPRKMSEKLAHIPLLIEVPAGTPPMVRLGEPVSSDATVLLRSKNEEIPDVTLLIRFAVE